MLRLSFTSRSGSVRILFAPAIRVNLASGSLRKCHGLLCLSDVSIILIESLGFTTASDDELFRSSSSFRFRLLGDVILLLQSTCPKLLDSICLKTTLCFTPRPRTMSG